MEVIAITQRDQINFGSIEDSIKKYNAVRVKEAFHFLAALRCRAYRLKRTWI